MDIREFLEARLSDDEAVARACGEPAEWTVYGSWLRPERRGRSRGEGQWVGAPAGGGEWQTVAKTYSMSAGAAHMARHDPARVLRDVEAKRRLLRDVLPEVEQMAGLIEHEYGAAPDRVGTGVADMVLRLVALSWSDHPDYDPSWSPEATGGE